MMTACFRENAAPCRKPFLRPESLTLALAGIYLLLILHLPLPNAGGAGFALPYNILSWGGMALITAAIWFTLRRPTAILTPSSLWLVMAAMLMTLPLLWLPAAIPPESILPRIAAIWGGVFFYFTLSQLTFSPSQLRAFFMLFALAGIMETLLIQLELWFPASLPATQRILLERYGRGALGVFQQVNVSASFLAATLVSMLGLLARPEEGSPRRRADLREALLALAVVATCATLVMIRSRIGLLGGLMAAVAAPFLLRCYRHRFAIARGRMLLIIALPPIGAALGVALLNVPLGQALEHAGSNYQRILTLQNSWALICEHPFRGWGLGMFEKVFQAHMANYAVNPNREQMAHPHNEILYLWLEGGVAALAGGVCVLIAGARLIFSFRYPDQWLAFLCTVPILLHTQVEFPLYYSTPHFFALLLFNAVADSYRARAVESQRPSFRLPFALAPAIGWASLLSSGLLFYCLYPAQVLSQFELQTTVRPDKIRALYAPWPMQERYRHDLSLLRLIDFRTVPDTRSLGEFLRENQRWLAYHADPDMYNNQIAVLRYSGRYREAQKLADEARKTFPWDNRFHQQ